MGPFRLNLSKSGVGISAGVRGTRIGVGPRGKHVSVGLGGIQYRQKIGGAPSAKHLPHPTNAPQVSVPHTRSDGIWGLLPVVVLLVVVGKCVRGQGEPHAETLQAEAPKTQLVQPNVERKTSKATSKRPPQLKTPTKSLARQWVDEKRLTVAESDEGSSEGIPP